MNSSSRTSPDSAGADELPHVLLGAGGHGRVLLDALLARGRRVAALLDPDPEAWGSEVRGVPVIGGDDRVRDFAPGDALLVNGVGGFADLSTRARLFREMRDAGYTFVGVRHSAAVVSDAARVDATAQVLAGVVVQADAEVGRDTIVNTGAVVEHDCRIDDGCHVASAAVLSGGVRLGEDVRIGAGATVLPGIEIGDGALVGAGAVVTRDVAPGVRVVGVPARVVNETRRSD